MPIGLGAGLAIAGGAQLLGGLVGGIGKNRAAKRMARRGQKMAKRGTADANAALAWRGQNPFEIAEEAKANLALAKNELNSSALQDQMMAQADRGLASMSGAINRTSTSSADALAALSKMYGQTQEGYNNALMAGAQERQSDLGNLMNANSQMADYKGIQYDQNINMPFLQRMELAQGKIAAGRSMQGATAQAQIDGAGMMGNVISGAGQLFGGLVGAGLFSGNGKTSTPNYNAEQGWYGSNG